MEMIVCSYESTKPGSIWGINFIVIVFFRSIYNNTIWSAMRAQAASMNSKMFCYANIYVVMSSLNIDRLYLMCPQRPINEA